VFVGRKAELAALREVLRGGEAAPRVVFVHGPAGVGKTTLLREYARIARASRMAVAYLDARRIEPSPGPFLGALAVALGRSRRASPLKYLGSRRSRHLLLVDTYEAVAPLDAWVCDVLLPQLPDHALLVLVGRQPPSAAWRTLAAAGPRIQLLALRNLGTAESRELLRRRRVPAGQHPAILAFAHGHPLALSLVAEVCAQRPGVSFQPEAAPEVVRTLLQQLVREVRSPAHRAAIEACALVRTTTEPLLAAMLAEENAYELFEWLAALSFVESGPDGLFPHDLAREVLASELRWRNPDWNATLTRRAHTYYRDHLRRSADWVYLHRHVPDIRSAFTWPAAGNLIVDRAQRSDVPALLAMVRRHEGDASARLAAHWLERQPRDIAVIRQGATEPVGFLATLTLDRSTPARDIAADPATAALWRYVRRAIHLRPEEVVTYHRFWTARDTYQAVSPVQTLCLAAALRHDQTRPRQAMGFLVVADPEFWAPVAEYTLTLRVPEVDFEVGGRRYGVYAKDWRRIPPEVYLEQMMQRALGVEAQPEAAPPPVVALSLEGFAQAIRHALRDLQRPLALRQNPLLHSRLVASLVGPDPSLEDRLAALQRTIREAAEAVRTAPRGAKLFRALEETYLRSAPQEIAAERLELPFSTYRYQVTQAVARVVDLLWQREIGAA
jgi:hypothetical protein